MTAPRPDDELLRRYHEASAQDTRGPGAHVRAAVRAHAQAVLAGQTTSRTTRPAPAANQPRWKLSLLASVAVVGLAGLLVLQFERGTPQEKELVAGQSAAGRSPATSAGPSTSREASPAAHTAPETQASAATATAPATATATAPAKAAPARSQAELPRALSPAPASPAPAAKAAPAPVAPALPVEVAPARSRLADTNANNALDEATISAGRAAAPAFRTVPTTPEAPRPDLAYPPSFAAAPAAAPRAQAQQQKQEERSSEQAGARELSRSAAASLHAAAGAGRLAQVEQLIAQGASVNTPDAMGKTPLMLAAINGHSTVVQRLLAAGANPALVDRDGVNALQHARRLGREAIAQMIEAGS
ncbi:MAG: ankyrin repeat domain-containing protein [Polaromonas sp.]|nr:ankyrin repeat domain-containing protein [Polaromonas sp.]